ncbi:uncharacterized protein LOC109848821 isoform X1 [Asparagus officinalis]|uniref:uncharacterized protein LOC109848821 isoform X1 n=1 Tax=Asparagus officinalis TaxID=4686 RepID=UPI00098DED90|nr:uncharacterized protein LOC109848821 isoform X1 [Asparagus officinalis]
MASNPELSSNESPVETLEENRPGTDLVDGSPGDASRVQNQDGDGNRAKEEGFVTGDSTEKGGSVVGLGSSKKDGSFEGLETKGRKEADGDLGSVAHYKFSLGEDKTGFFIDDLVWGKVKSHPWWPGQIFDPKYASEMALKRQKKDHFLVAYFGDKSFAWVPESNLKPFQSNFSTMEKQSSMESFSNAVDSIIEEVSRRVELGMACCCLADEIYADLKYKQVENAGILEGTCSSTVDRSWFVNAFQPQSLLECIRVLAQCPFGRFDRLGLTIATAQLKAFYHTKGRAELAAYVSGDGLVENDAEVPISESKVSGKAKASSAPIALAIESGKKTRGRPRKNPIPEDVTEGKSLKKQKKEEDAQRHAVSTPVASTINSGKRRGRPPKNHISKDASEQKKEEYAQLASSAPVASNVESGKRQRRRPSKYQIYEDGTTDQKSSSEEREEDDNYLAEGDEIGSKVKSTRASSRKQMIDSDSVGLGRRKRGKIHKETDSETEILSSTRARSMKVGDRIRRISNQLKGMPGILKSNEKSPRDNVFAAEDYSSPSEMLSQLCLAAADPSEGQDFLSMIISFFTHFRASIASSSFEDQEPVKSTGRKRGRKKKVTSSEPSSSGISGPDYIQDSYWSDIVLQSSPEREPVSKGQKRSHKSQKKGKMKNTRTAGEQEVNGERITRNIVEAVKEETPTALILSFTETDSLPSVAELIKIFSPYGPLREEETEVLRKTSRAKVVFKYRHDAEKAFSSAGKYSVFGPALVSYRLRYTPSPKSSPATSPQGKSDASPSKDGNSKLQGTEVPTANM